LALSGSYFQPLVATLAASKNWDSVPFGRTTLELAGSEYFDIACSAIRA